MSTVFTLETVWAMPELGNQWQFTLRSTTPEDPARGATFYLPEGSPDEVIAARSAEVAAKFRSLVPRSKLPLLPL